MRSKRLFVGIVSVLSASLSAQVYGPGRHEGAQPAVPAPLGEAMPQLHRQSVWAQDARYEGPRPDRRTRGVYPVGNGYAFCYLGLGERANTMQAVTGPFYMAAEQHLPRGHFGGLTLDLGDVDLPSQKLRRVKGANFVVTEDASDAGLALRTLTFASPGSHAITRVIEVVNGGDRPVEGLVLRLTTDAGGQWANGRLVKQYAGGDYRCHAIVTLPGSTATDDSLRVEIGALAPGKRFQTAMTVTTAKGATGAEPSPTSVAIARVGAQTTWDWWEEKLADTPHLRSDHVRMMDLVNDWKVLMLTMRDARSGVVVPMVTHRGAWIRESTGPLLTFLRFNMWDEAKALINYYYDAIRLTGEIREYYPLDLDFSALDGKETDWKKIGIPETELPSWVVLHHFWYYRATRDARLIKDHQPLLIACLQRQKRSQDSLMHFSGNENYFDALYSLDLEALGQNPLFIAHDESHGRQAWSLGSGLLFLIAMHAYGELLDAVDELENPAKWQAQSNEIDKPSRRWLERSFTIMQDIEKRYWVQKAGFPVRSDIEDSLKLGDDWTGLFAPAISPVTGEPHVEPFANLNLFPLWIGFTFPTGERSRHNLRNTLGRLWHATDEQGNRTSALVGTTATVGHFTGDVPGMLLTALVERDGRDRSQVQEDLLRIAEPAGEWGRLYDPEGRPIADADPDWPQRLSPNECGINLDALLFSLNGVRHVNVPNFDNDSIKVKLRLPNGATFLEMENLKKDGRAFNVHITEHWARLSPEELEVNAAQQDPRYKRDPEKQHRRFRFKMALVSENPPSGSYQVDADVAGTMFVRRLYRSSTGGDSDNTGDIEESEFWNDDKAQFYLDGSPTLVPERSAVPSTEGATVLALTWRPLLADLLANTKATIVDTGLPFTGAQLVATMLDAERKPTHPRLYLDLAYDAADRRTAKRARFWSHDNWAKALTAFEQGGGEILRPRFVSDFEVVHAEGGQKTIAPDGRLELPADREQTVRFTLRYTPPQGAARTSREAILRVGTGCGYELTQGEVELSSRSGARPALPDLDAVLIELAPGTNTFTLRLHGAGAHLAFVRCTDAAGLPLGSVE